MIKHKLKVLTEFYDDVESGRKPFEVRFNDRDFKVGDILELNDIIITINLDTGYKLYTYTGRKCIKEITYILDNPDYCKEGYVILGIKEYEL